MPKTEMKCAWNHQNEVALPTLAQGTSNKGPYLSRGTGSDERVGNVINASALHFKGVLYNNSTQETYVRMLIIGYPTLNGDIDYSTNLYEISQSGTVSGLNTISGLDTMYFPINKKDYKVYRDKVYKLAGSVSGSAGTNTRMFNHFVKFNKRKIIYDGVSNATNSWTYNIILIAADSNDDTSTGTVCELSSLTRFYYTDA